MTQLRRKRYHRFGGLQAPEHIQDWMKRLHPRCRIIFNRRGRKWGILDKGFDGDERIVRWLDGKPTMQNTVHYLSGAAAHRFVDPKALEEMHQNMLARDDRIADDAWDATEDERMRALDEIAHILIPGTQVSMTGAADGKPAGSPGSR